MTNGPADRERMRALRCATVGVEFVVTVAAFIGGGLALDHALGTLPAMVIVGAVLGFAAGLYHLVRSVLRIQRESR